MRLRTRVCGLWPWEGGEGRREGRRGGVVYRQARLFLALARSVSTRKGLYFVGR